MCNQPARWPVAKDTSNAMWQFDQPIRFHVKYFFVTVCLVSIDHLVHYLIDHGHLMKCAEQKRGLYESFADPLLVNLNRPN